MASAEMATGDAETAPDAGEPRRGKRNSAKQFGVNVISNVGTKIIQITVLVWVNQYLLKRIDTNEYALFPLITSLIFFVQFVRIMATGGIARYLVVADSRDDDEEVTRITSSMLPVLLGVAVVIGIGGGWAVANIDHLLEIDSRYLWDARLMLTLILVSMAVNIVATPFASGLYVRQKFTIINLIQLGCELGRNAILILLILGVGPRVIWLVVGTFVGDIGNVLLRVVATRRLIPAIRLDASKFSWATCKELLQFGAWTSTRGISRFLSRTSPVLLLNKFGSPLDLTVFHLGQLPDTQLQKIISAAMVPVDPAITRMHAQSGEDSMKSIYYRGNRYSMWLALLLPAPLIVLAGPIIELYVGTGYATAAAIMVLFLVRYPVLFASSMFYRVAQATARVQTFYTGQIAVQLASVASMFLAARDGIGVVGMTTAMCVTEIVLTMLLIWVLGLRFVNGTWTRFLWTVLLPGGAPFVASLLACYGVSKLTEIDSWTTVALTGAFASLVYILVVLAMTDGSDRQLLQKARRTIASRLGSRKNRDGMTFASDGNQSVT